MLSGSLNECSGGLLLYSEGLIIFMTEVKCSQ